MFPLEQLFEYNTLLRIIPCQINQEFPWLSWLLSYPTESILAILLRFSLHVGHVTHVCIIVQFKLAGSLIAILGGKIFLDFWHISKIP